MYRSQVPKIGLRARTLITLLLSTLLLGVAGCQDNNTTTSSVGTPNPNTLQPKGTVEGVLKDAVTNQPIVGAVVDIGVGKAVTTSTGQYVIANVPATKDSANGTVTGSYSVTIDLRKVTSPVDMTKSTTTTRYPDFSYSAAQVTFTSLKDTGSSTNHTQNGGNAGGGSGSNHATPVDGLVSNQNLFVGKLDATINGVVAYGDNTTNKKDQAVGQGWTVKLVSSGCANSSSGCVGHVIGSTTTDANGAFTFANVEADTNVCLKAWNANDTYATQVGGTNNCLTTPSDGETLTMAIQSANGANNHAALLVYNKDNLDPAIIQTSPVNHADIAPSASGQTTDVVFTFSEPIKQTPETDTNAANPNGLQSHVYVNFDGTKQVVGVLGNIVPAFAWNSTYTQLTVSFPTAVSSMYTVDLNGACGNDGSNLALTDNNGNPLAAGLSCVQFTTNGATTPGAPAAVTVTNRASIDWTGVNPVLDWPPVSGAVGYNVYRSMNGTGQYVKVGSTNISSFTDNNLPALTPSAFVQGDNPVSYSYQVTSLSSDGTESAPTATTQAASDTVAPTVCQVVGGTCNQPTTYDPTTKQLTLVFSEPMNQASVTTAANYSQSGGATITGPIVYSQDTVNNVYKVTITYDQNPLVGDTLTVQSNGVTDVAGNAMATTTAYAFDTPTAPSNVTVLDGPFDYYGSTQGFGGQVQLHWSLPSSGVASVAHYNVYESSDGGVTFGTNPVSQPNLSSATVFLPGYFPGPFVNGQTKVTYQFKVTAVGPNGGESPAAVSGLIGDTTAPADGSIADFGYNTTSHILTLRFPEPMDQASAETVANYTLTTTTSNTISSVVYDPNTWEVRLTLSGNPAANDTLTVNKNGVTDVAGNAYKTDQVAHTF